MLSYMNLVESFKLHLVSAGLSMICLDHGTGGRVGCFHAPISKCYVDIVSYFKDVKPINRSGPESRDDSKDPLRDVVGHEGNE